MMQIRQLTKHQEHVVKHIFGCRILGVYAQPEHLHFLLDIPYLWSVDADGSMALVQDEEAIRGLNVPEAVADALSEEAQALREDGAEAVVRYFAHPPREIGAIEDVTLYARETETHMQVIGESGVLTAAWQGATIRLLEG
ncbi:MAG: hypothetical protein NZ585_08760 [Chloracidobacterium sp.]|nr:hypothetical protein [Chloracidobacterium sp.]MDW8217394.1 hypothetical protein [Acidobacteriota bacterium]